MPRCNDRDWSDIQASLTGDADAYARLMRRKEPEKARLMWRFSRDRGTCEELVQDAFVEAYFSLRRYRGDAPFPHWLRRIGTRAGYRHWKRHAKDRHRVPLPDLEAIPAEPEEMDPAAAGALLHALLARLPVPDRLVLTLMYFEELSAKQIAERMGWSAGMVKMRAMRARRKIKAIAERENLVEALQWTR